VTDAQGQPVIMELVHVTYADGDPSDDWSIADKIHLTDDRGVYRIYGLPAHRYFVFAGVDRKTMLPDLFARNHNPITFYPGVAEEARARAVEVTSASETSGIDIKMGVPDKGYSVRGRIVGALAADSKAGLTVTLSLIDLVSGGGSNISPVRYVSSYSSGEFRIDNVTPGRYQITAGTAYQISADP